MTFSTNPPIKTRGRKQGPVNTASKICTTLFDITRAQELTYRTMCKRAGFAQNGLTRWARGQGSPSLIVAEAWAEVLGYEILVVKKEE